MDNFIQSAESVGQHCSVGEFSLDWTAADRELANFYRQHPGLWFLKFIQGALALGSRSINVSDSNKALLISCYASEVPPLADLVNVPSEAQRDFVTAIRATFGSEPELEELSMIRAPEGDEPRVLSFSRGREAREEELPAKLTGEINSYGSSSLAQFHLRFQWQTGAWWPSFRKRVRRHVTLTRLCAERLAFSPVPLTVSGFSFGQGSGRPYDAVAAEYILAPLTRDTLVRENEPGNGSSVYELFGVRTARLALYPRLFTRWCQVVHPLWSGEDELLDPARFVALLPQAKTGPVAWLKSIIPDNSVPIFKKTPFLGYQLAGHVELPEHYRPSGSRNGRDTPGLPVFACIVIPSSLRGPGRVSFFRRGVLMCQGTMDLGLPGVDVSVCCDQLKTDFSGMAVVQDDTYYALEAALRQRTLKLARDTVNAGFGWRTRFLQQALAQYSES